MWFLLHCRLPRGASRCPAQTSGPTDYTLGAALSEAKPIVRMDSIHRRRTSENRGTPIDTPTGWIIAFRRASGPASLVYPSCRGVNLYSHAPFRNGPVIERLPGACREAIWESQCQVLAGCSKAPVGHGSGGGRTDWLVFRSCGPRFPPRPGHGLSRGRQACGTTQRFGAELFSANLLQQRLDRGERQGKQDARTVFWEVFGTSGVAMR